MARILQCGFEERSLTAGVELDVIGATGPLSIQNTVARVGGYALEVNTAAQTSNVQLKAYSSIQARQGFLRFYLYIGSLPSSSCYVAALIGGASDSVALLLTTTGTLELLNAAGTQVGAASAAMATGTWYRIDLYVDATTSPGTVAARLNGVVFASGANSSQIDWSTVQVGAFVVTNTATLYFDDIALNDDTGTAETSYPEDGHIIHLRPAAQGDINGFSTTVGGTAGQANNWTRVDEVPPDNATSYNAASTVKQDLFEVGAVTINPPINCVMVGGVATQSAADTALAFEWQAEQKSSGTVASSAAVVPDTTTWVTNPGQPGASAYPLVMYTDPTGAAWTLSTIGTMQIGYELTTIGTGGHQIRVTNVWASVDYQVWFNETAAISASAVVAATNAEADPLTSSISGSAVAVAATTKVVSLTCAITSVAAVAAVPVEAEALTAAIAPSLALSAQPSQAVSISGSMVATSAVGASNSAAAPLTSLIAPAAVVAAMAQESSALVSTIASSLALQGLMTESTPLSATVASVMNLLAVTAENEQLAAAIALSLIVNGAVVETVSLTANPTASSLVAASILSSKVLTASVVGSSAVLASLSSIEVLFSAVSSSAVVSASIAEKAALSSAISSVLGITVSNTETGLLVCSIQSISALLASTSKEVALSLSISAAGALSALNTEIFFLTSSFAGALGLSALNTSASKLTASISSISSVAALGLVRLVPITADFLMAAVLLGYLTEVRFITVGRQTMVVVVQPAMDFQQQSLLSTVQPAMDLQQQSLVLVAQPALS